MTMQKTNKNKTKHHIAAAFEQGNKVQVGFAG